MKLYVKGARGSYTSTLFEPKAAKGSTKLKYSVSAIIEPETMAFAGDAHPDSALGQSKGYKWMPFKQAAGIAITDAATGRWKDKAGEVLALLKAQNRILLRDGAEKSTTPGYAGNMFFNASNEVRPQVRNKNGSPLEAKDGVIYSGAYIDLAVDVWAQDNEHGKRINASLLSVVFDKDGERLAGSTQATDDDYAAIPEKAQAQAAATGGGAGSLFS